MRDTHKAVATALLCGLLTAAVPLGGCASKYGTQTTAVNHYPDCYRPIQELRQAEYRPQKTAAGGALVGAGLGALIGYLATGKGSGAAVGAATGAVVGGAAGGIYGSENQKSDDANMLAQYNTQLDGNITEVNRATAAAKVARQCYERQFTVAANEYKTGRLSREQFNSRYQEVTSGLQEAANILGDANRSSAAVYAEYNRSLEEETARVSRSGSQSSEQRRQLTEMRGKSKTMERSVKASQEEERLLLERLSATHKQAQDLMS